MNIACCQFDIVWEDKLRNFEQVENLVAAARLPPQSLLLLPEMFATGFSMHVDAVLEDEGGPTAKWVSELARTFSLFVVAGGAFRRPDGRPANQCLVVNPAGERIAQYCKMQPFVHGGEAAHYPAGERIITFAWNGFTVAPFICYDLRFPELFRIALARGANLFTVISSWPDARLDHWVKLLQARAIENQAFVAGANRCGNDPDFHYSGRSLIVGPDGKILRDAGEAPAIISYPAELQTVLQYRSQLPFFRDARSGVWADEFRH